MTVMVLDESALMFCFVFHFNNRIQFLVKHFGIYYILFILDLFLDLYINIPVFDIFLFCHIVIKIDCSSSFLILLFLLYQQ